MQKRLPSLPALVAFEASAKHLSFCKAADELCVTHSAVAHRIRQLEEHVGAQLFVRKKNRRAVLTEHGRSFLAVVSEVLCKLDAASAQAHRVQEKTLRIGVGPSLQDWLVGRLADYQRHHKEVTLEVSVSKCPTPDKLASLRSGEVDLAIRYVEPIVEDGLTITELLKVDLFPVCSPTYIRTLRSLQKPTDLLKATLLRVRDEPWAPWLRKVGLQCREPSNTPLFSDVKVMVEAAASGLGVGLVRDVMAEPYLLTGRLVKVLHYIAPSSASYCAASRREIVAQRPDVVSFIDWLISTSRAGVVC